VRRQAASRIGAVIRSPVRPRRGSLTPSARRRGPAIAPGRARTRLLLRLAGLAILALTTAAAARGQGVLEVLEISYRIEMRLLEGELERYEEARRRQREADNALSEREDRLDQAIRAREAPLDELQRLEREAAAAREAADAAASELARIRSDLYARMARVAELDVELEEERGRRLVPPSRLDGFWELEIQPTGEVGLLKLRVEGTLITGTYRFGNGGQGSVRGTMAGDRVDLERIDSEYGFDAVLEGDFQPANLRMRGRWTAVDLSGGRFGGGTWSARKLTPAEEERLEVP
ncbi:MAG: hypothetical protein R3190_11605, partial [Thermoanaerobaculia bacterium]|nr:hypothetical protein [Thermoanaerobaculia bacterium]